MAHRARLALLLAVGALALAPAGSMAGSGVKAPKNTTYAGHTDRGGKLSVTVSGKSIQVLAIQFKCHDTVGHTSLQDVPLKKTSRGYKFGVDSFGIVSYDDGYPDENARVEVYGRFARGARSAKGKLKVRAPRCGTGLLGFFIKR